MSISQILGTNFSPAGIEIVRKAIRQPCMTIARNAGVDAATVVERILGKNEVNFGYDAMRGEYVNLIEKGIVDPTKVSGGTKYNWLFEKNGYF